MLLQHYGGSASSTYTAPSFPEACKNFRNLLPLTAVNNLTPLKYTAHEIHTLVEKHYSANNVPIDDSSLSQTNSKHNRTFSTHKREARMESHSGDKSEKDSNQYRRESLDMSHEFLDPLVPASHVIVNHTTHRKRRTVDDSAFERDASTGGYCLIAGRQGSGGNVHLCTQCQYTRHLGDDVFPSFIQEVVCSPTDSPCLNIANHGPQGSCHESRIPVSILRRNHGRCMRVTLTSGQSLVFDDWRLAQLMVRTGCQCMLDSRSALAASL